MLVSNCSNDTVKRVSFFVFNKKKWIKQKCFQDFGSNICLLSKNSVSVIIAYGNNSQLLRNTLSIIFLPLIHPNNHTPTIFKLILHPFSHPNILSSIHSQRYLSNQSSIQAKSVHLTTKSAIHTFIRRAIIISIDPTNHLYISNLSTHRP